MQKLDLKQMMGEAKADTKAIEKLKGDWRTQIQMLNRTVSVVTTYQKAIHKAFGTPNGHRKDHGQGHRVDFYFNLPEGVVALEEFEEIESLSFKGAALVQTLEVLHHADSHASGMTVKYKAILKVDENYFLGQMLPQVQPLRNADPDYTIYDLAIEIPKGELVAESLQMLNDRINGVEEEVKKAQPEPDLERLTALLRVFGDGSPQTVSVPSTVPITAGVQFGTFQNSTVWHPNAPQAPRFLPQGAF